MNNTDKTTFQNVVWPVQNVLACTTSRHPLNVEDKLSVSSNTSFAHFNLGNHVGDDPKVVTHNRKKLAQHFNNKKYVQFFEQVHGNNVAMVDEYSTDTIAADAAITTNRDVVLAIMTADCLPILLADHNGTEVAAIHGGWRPLASNIIANTISKMNSQVSELYAWLGPCIGPKAFEVGENVRRAFFALGSEFSTAFTEITPFEEERKYLADLHAIARIQLASLGIKHISALPHCTFTLEDQYYSYRRENVTGRMATAICRR